MPIKTFRNYYFFNKILARDVYIAGKVLVPQNYFENNILPTIISMKYLLILNIAYILTFWA